MRNDKLLVDREHLLMALANVDFILIRATNTEGTLDAGYVLRRSWLDGAIGQGEICNSLKSENFSKSFLSHIGKNKIKF